MRKLILAAAILVLAACATPQDDSYGAGFVAVSESDWYGDHYTPYPFTTSGEISCAYHVELGRGVFFNPVGFTDESYVGTPLNKAAANTIKLSGITPNVPYRVKTGVDLSEAREIGLRVCDEQLDKIEGV
ncbi:hypothetical protein [Psychrobacter sp. DAB_AL43B]|uniref:hypothetical protein n=1 Tax=Psychrobacter sp. DAB_AL43B TaxID=1028416 RepID=UPI0009C3BAFF|nr:hypothetical protein [Psychrobacter sp. DAB_AL43B]SLJ84463.1 hypothetical protein DABAL43B_1267 [Psychrobacter sp. DAB_AL43B]